MPGRAATLDSPVFQALGKTFQRAKIGAGTIAFNAGNNVPLELPNALLQKGITLRLTGNLVISTANAQAIFSEAPLGLVKNIRVVGDGRRTLINSPMRDLFRLNHHLWGKLGELLAPGATTNGGAGVVTTGTRAFAATVRIDHEMLMALNPVESLFDPRLFKKVTVEIQWGDATSIATAGGGGTIALTSTQVDVLVDQTSEGVTEILFDHEVTPDEQTVTASSALFSFKVPQNGLLVGFMLRSDRDPGDGTGPRGVDDVINTVTLKSDTTVAHLDNVNWSTLQRENALQFDIDLGAGAGGQIPGYAFVNMLEHGMLSSALNTNALNDLRLILNVTNTSGTQVVHVTYLFLVPRKALAQAVAA